MVLKKGITPSQLTMTILKPQARIFVTGSAGFIGFHLSKLLLEEGFFVRGFDAITDYYDISLKEARLSILSNYPNFSFSQGRLENLVELSNSVNDYAPVVIVHLAAQAGVRYSLENPHSYIQSNVVGTMNVLEIARNVELDHLLMASTSSVYGANMEMPFCEIEKTDSQLTIYSATKKANESMSHAYSHLWNLPITMFRFFTVYGPWGRPDMALFKFVDAVLRGEAIDVYNSGEMYRDFTYIDDLVVSIRRLIDVVPPLPNIRNREATSGDSLSPVAAWRVVNIGNSDQVKLLDFIEAIEASLGITAQKNLMPMQLGDVHSTWADSSLLKVLTGFQPSTPITKGIEAFVDWFRGYYNR